MGSYSPSNKKINSDFNRTKSSEGFIGQTQNNLFRDRLSSDPQQIQKANDTDKLQPIRRHSNIYNREGQEGEPISESDEKYVNSSDLSSSSLHENNE